jgi:hypothetical protein
MSYIIFSPKCGWNNPNTQATNCVLQVLCAELGSSVVMHLTGRCVYPDFDIIYLGVDEFRDEIRL